MFLAPAIVFSFWDSTTLSGWTGAWKARKFRGGGKLYVMSREALFKSGFSWFLFLETVMGGPNRVGIQIRADQIRSLGPSFQRLLFFFWWWMMGFRDVALHSIAFVTLLVAGFKREARRFWREKGKLERSLEMGLVSLWTVEMI